MEMIQYQEQILDFMKNQDSEARNKVNDFFFIPVSVLEA